MAFKVQIRTHPVGPSQQCSPEGSILQDIDPDLREDIFELAGDKDLYSMAQVCRSWHQSVQNIRYRKLERTFNEFLQARSQKKPVFWGESERLRQVLADYRGSIWSLDPQSPNPILQHLVAKGVAPNGLLRPDGRLMEFGEHSTKIISPPTFPSYI